MGRIPEGPETFFRLSPVARSEASCFAVKRGEIAGRFDVNYWRLTPLFLARFSKPLYPVTTLGSVILLAQYGSSSLATEMTTGVPMLRMNNLQNDGWDLRDLKYIKLGGDELERYRVVPGDILFNRTNSKELVGKCEVFSEQGDWVFASYLIRIRLHDETVLPQYASDFLSTRAGRLQIDRLSRQIIGMTNINAEELKEILLPVPPLPRQQELVVAMDTARATRQTKLAEACALLSGLDGFLLQTLKLTPLPNDDRKIFSIPKGSVSGRFDPHFHAPEFVRIQEMLATTTTEPLGNLATFSRETWSPLDHGEATFRYIEISCVNPQTGEGTWNVVATAEAPSRARMLVRENDIIVSLTRPHHGSIANMDATFDGCVASTGFAVIREVQAHVLRDYLWCVLRTQFCLRQMLQRSSGGNYPAITQQELANITIPVPPVDVQATIIAEAYRRRDEARSLRIEAETEWQAAKSIFEEQLLGPDAP